MSVDEYFEFEAASALRHELVGGEIYAMSGATRRHARIVANVLTHLHAAASGGPCECYAEAVKLRVGDSIYYPDIVVTCSDTDSDEHVVREPCVLVEITSPGSARIDRTEKALVYRAIPSLRAYLVVEQGWRRVVHHWREGDVWHARTIDGDGSIAVPCPESELTLAQIYEGLQPLTVRELEAIGYSVD
jgi:Uma2 family endonuclease